MEGIDIKPMQLLVKELIVSEEDQTAIQNGLQQIAEELNKEMKEYHSSNSSFKQRFFYSFACQYAQEVVAIIGDRRQKISQYSTELRKMEKELAILHTLKMEQNIADVEKNKKLRNNMISKWRFEVDKKLYEMKDLEGKVSSLLNQQMKEDFVVKEPIAHFYSICSVLQLEYTLSPQIKKELQIEIMRFKEGDLNLLKKKKTVNANANANAKTKIGEKKTWKTTPSHTVFSIAEIQKEELAKRKR